MAVADLRESQLTCLRAHLIFSQMAGQGCRCQDSALYHANSSGSSPGHALEEPAPINAIVGVIVLNHPSRNAGKLLIVFHLSLLIEGCVSLLIGQAARSQSLSEG